MVDDARVRRSLRALIDDVSVLRDEARASPERRGDPLWMRGVKYAFVTAIGACADVARHVCAAEGWGPPRDDADAMSVLARHAVIDDALGDRMHRLVGFRDVLVDVPLHDDVEVGSDDSVVARRLGDLGDLEAFSAHVAAYVDAHRG